MTPAGLGPVPRRRYKGNAATGAPADRGWLLGHFLPAEDPRYSEDVEIKWGVHTKGDRRARWVTGEVRTAVILLIRGRFRIEFRDGDVVLGEQGDYVVFSGVDHSWEAEEDSVIVGVRWPSISGYAV